MNAAVTVPVVAYERPQHRVDCAQHDPTPGRCDCGAPCLPLIRQRDHLATVAALQARINALEARQWQPLTDEDRTRAFQSLPDMLDGFMKTWGWLHFAKAVEAICREKNAQPDTSKEQP